jgi:hypothetical protein
LLFSDEQSFAPSPVQVDYRSGIPGHSPQSHHIFRCQEPGKAATDQTPLHFAVVLNAFAAKYPPAQATRRLLEAILGHQEGCLGVALIPHAPNPNTAKSMA